MQTRDGARGRIDAEDTVREGIEALGRVKIMSPEFDGPVSGETARQ
jgi:hypothetical protein